MLCTAQDRQSIEVLRKLRLCEARCRKVTCYNLSQNFKYDLVFLEQQSGNLLAKIGYLCSADCTGPICVACTHRWSKF